MSERKHSSHIDTVNIDCSKILVGRFQSGVVLAKKDSEIDRLFRIPMLEY